MWVITGIWECACHSMFCSGRGCFAHTIKGMFPQQDALFLALGFGHTHSLFVTARIKHCNSCEHSVAARMSGSSTSILTASDPCWQPHTLSRLSNQHLADQLCVVSLPQPCCQNTPSMTPQNFPNIYAAAEEVHTAVNKLHAEVEVRSTHGPQTTHNSLVLTPRKPAPIPNRPSRRRRLPC